MFYQTLLELCEKNKIKPTALMTKLGFSPGNVKRWEQGATVNSNILITLSQYFDVSIDYLLFGINTNEPIQNQLSKDEIKVLNYYHKLDEENKDYMKGQMIQLQKEQEQQEQKQAALEQQKLDSQKELA